MRARRVFAAVLAELVAVLRRPALLAGYVVILVLSGWHLAEPLLEMIR